MTVLDASAILEILLKTPVGLRCMNEVLQAGEDLCVPHMVDIEVTQVLRRLAASREIGADRGLQAIGDLRDLPLIRYPHEPFLPRIWELRNSLSAYDAAYVALAEALDAPLLTCDTRITRAHGHRARVRVVGQA